MHHLDVLVFAAHPDDAELSMGGTIAKLAKKGLKVGIYDLTRGELGTRGSVDIRQEEAVKAGVILKVAMRENLDLPDGNIELTNENIHKVVTVIRRHKPAIVFAPYKNDRHPDHMDASALIKRAVFASGLPKVTTFFNNHHQDAYRPSKIYYYMQTFTFEPSFIVDVSGFFDTKMASVEAFKSQFHDPKNKEPETFISQPGFMEFIKSRAKFYGFKIGKEYGEPFYCEENIEYDFSADLKK